MKWKEIKIKINREFEDIISYVLYDNGASGLEIEDSMDILSLQNCKESWELIDKAEIVDNKMICIKAYFSLDKNTDQIIENISKDINTNYLISTEDYEIITTEIDETDWAENWKKYYKPVEIGNNIIIKPVWEKIENPKKKIVIDIDPGMAFGTGTHETTSLCIEALEKYVKAGDKVFDIGCGSGILSIAAIKLGAKNALAVDIDATAIRVSKENVALNGVKDSVDIQKGNLLDLVQGKGDIIVANIIAEIIVPMISDLSKHLNDGGIFISSGIIIERKDLILNELKKYDFKVLEIIEKNGWLLIVASR